MKQYIFTILFTAFLTFALSWAVWQLSMRFKLYPGIRERDVHKTPTPRLGGVAMFFGIVAAFVVSRANDYFNPFWSAPQQIYGILGAMLLIVIVGLVVMFIVIATLLPIFQLGLVVQ